MGTPIFDELLLSLSFKIGDPVSTGSSDGQVFSLQQKTDYLNRAYARLRRTLASTTKDTDLALPNLAKMVTLYAADTELLSTADQAFGSDSGNWSGTGWSVAGGVLAHTAGANLLTLSGYNIIPGRNYTLSVKYVSSVDGTMVVSLGGVAKTASTLTGTQTIVYTFTAVDNSTLTFLPSALWAGSIDDLSLKIADASNAALLLTTGMPKSYIQTREIKQVYLKSATEIIDCHYIDPAKFLPVSLGVNDYYNTDGSKAFFSDLAGKLHIIKPSDFTITEIWIYCISDVPAYISGGAEDIVISPSYKDLLMNLAAKEAMQDRGDAVSTQKVQLYDNDFFGEIKIIATRTQVNPDTEEIK
jgi:hypothetical protein